MPVGFDPWTAKFDLREEWEAVGTPAYAQWRAAQAILQLRDLVEKDRDGIAVLTAISFAVRHGLVVPDWLANAYLKRFIRFERCEVASLDEAFDHMPTTERVRAAQEKRAKLMPQISELLVEAITMNPARAVDNELFDEIAEKLGIGQGPCRDLYAEGVREHGMQDLVQLKQLHRRYKKSGETADSPVIKRKR